MVPLKQWNQWKALFQMRVVPSRYFDDPVEAEEAMKLSKIIIDLVEKKIMN